MGCVWDEDECTAQKTSSQMHAHKRWDDAARSFEAAAAYFCAFGAPESRSLPFALFAHHVPAREQPPPAMKAAKMMIAGKPSMKNLPFATTASTETL